MEHKEVKTERKKIEDSVNVAEIKPPTVGAELRAEKRVCRDWRGLKSVEDWKREFEKHAEWKERSTFEMKRDKESGANAFYQAYRNFCTAESKQGKGTYKELFEAIFPRRLQNWSEFKTLRDWKREFDRHPEWVGKSTSAMTLNRELGGNGFCQAFRSFCTAESKGDKGVYKELFEAIFPRRLQDWSKLTTVEDWKGEFNQCLQWAGKNTAEMQHDKESGAKAFYAAFQKFCTAQSKGDKDIYNQLIESIFPRKREDWSKFKTIEDWKREFDNHPEWKGRSTHAMIQDRESGANAYYIALQGFCTAEARGDEKLYDKLFEVIFPRRHQDWSEFTTIQDWKRKYDEHPEWKGRSTTEMKRDKESGAHSFYCSLNRFCSGVAGDNRPYRLHLFGRVISLAMLPKAVTYVSHESLNSTEGADKGHAIAEIDKVNKETGDIYELKLPSGSVVSLYSVQMKSGSVWVCTRAEWKVFLAAYGLREKRKHGARNVSHASLIDLL